MIIKFKKKIFILIPILIFLFFILQGINLPYVGPNATNDNGYSLIAHNLNKYGYLQTRFAPVTSIAQTLPEKPSYFFHHPNLLSFTESLFFRVFGEGFWVGRLTVITFAFGSLLLLFAIAKLIGNRRYAITVFFVSSIIPAFTIYGKLLGHEPLVLFYCLLALYAVLKYLSSDNKKFLLLASLAIILGTLSDWPTLYFIPCFFLLFIKHKKSRIAIYLFLLACCVAMGVLIDIYLTEGGLQNIGVAIALRSVNGLLSTPFWPIRWIGATIFRVGIYLNPLLVILSSFSLYEIYTKLKKQKATNQHLVILGLFLFGSIHILLYTQASFTHPYFIYYLMPFIIFGSSLMLVKLLSRRAYVHLAFIIGFCLIYLSIIETYKNIQMTSNLWRDELTQSISAYLIPYEDVALNGLSIIDTDVLWYRSSVNTTITDKVNALDTTKHNHYVHSCVEKCKSDDVQLAFLKRNYKFIYLNSNTHAEAYLFFLQEKVNHANKKDQKPLRVIQIIDPNNNNAQNKKFELIWRMYRFIRDTLNVPQL